MKMWRSNVFLQLIWIYLFLFNIIKIHCQENLPLLDVPFEPTHPAVVEAMLNLADIHSKDILYDLGCGDGRIVVSAVKKFGISGVGIDIDPQRIAEANENAQIAGVANKVQFITGDLMNFKIDQATVVTLYLLERINLQLRPKLFQQLKPGTRVISHAFDMGIWEADTIITHSKARNRKMFYWLIPAPVGGDWYWTMDIPQKNTRWKIRFDQEFQGTTFKIDTPQETSLVSDVKLRGDNISFAAEFMMEDSATTVVFEGKVHKDTIKGTQKWENGKWAGLYPWRAICKPIDIAGAWKCRIFIPKKQETEFRLSIRKLENDNYSWEYSDATTSIIKFPHYQWGANIRFEIDGHVFKGFVQQNTITGKVELGENGRCLHWEAIRLR